MIKNDVCLNKFKNRQILILKISHRFLVSTKVSTGVDVIKLFTIEIYEVS